MANQTQAEAAVLAQTASNFRSTNTNLNAMLKRLMSELEALESAWQGRGAMAFAQAKQRWLEDMAKLHRALDETANAIEKSGTYYSSTDDASAGRLNSIQGASVQLPL